MPTKIVSNTIVIIDHANATLYRTVPARAGASASDIAPDKPQHFRHYIDRNEHDADREENYPQDIAFFEQIAAACSSADRIVIIGRGHGQSNEAQHLIAYFASHHSEMSRRVLPVITADLSRNTDAQMIVLGHHTLHTAAMG